MIPVGIRENPDIAGVYYAGLHRRNHVGPRLGRTVQIRPGSRVEWTIWASTTTLLDMDAVRLPPLMRKPLVPAWHRQ